MSTLGALETAIVDRIAGTQIEGQSIFAVVRGASGTFRADLREALSRERTPAAYVAFIQEPTDPATSVNRRGPQFAVFVTARSLRPGSNPRVDEPEAYGALTLLDELRARLDYWLVFVNARVTPVHVRFLDADDRAVFYEILFRIAPLSSAPQFAGETLGSSATRTTRPLGLPDPLPAPNFVIHIGNNPMLIHPATLLPDTETQMVWQGELRAATLTALNAQIDSITSHITNETVATLVDSDGRNYPTASILTFTKLTPRYVDPQTSEHVQPCEVVFYQPTELPT